MGSNTSGGTSKRWIHWHLLTLMCILNLTSTLVWTNLNIIWEWYNRHSANAVSLFQIQTLNYITCWAYIPLAMTVPYLSFRCGRGTLFLVCTVATAISLWLQVKFAESYWWLFAASVFQAVPQPYILANVVLLGDLYLDPSFRGRWVATFNGAIAIANGLLYCFLVLYLAPADVLWWTTAITYGLVGLLLLSTGALGCTYMHHYFHELWHPLWATPHDDENDDDSTNEAPKAAGPSVLTPSNPLVVGVLWSIAFVLMNGCAISIENITQQMLDQENISAADQVWTNIWGTVAPLLCMAIAGYGIDRWSSWKRELPWIGLVGQALAQLMIFGIPGTLWVAPPFLCVWIVWIYTWCTVLPVLLLPALIELLSPSALSTRVTNHQINGWLVMGAMLVAAASSLFLLMPNATLESMSWFMSIASFVTILLAVTGRCLF